MLKSNAAQRGARLLALALVLRCGAAAASSPYMVKDIDDASANGLEQMLGEAGGLFYFTAQGFLHRSDGTRPGTYPLSPLTSAYPFCTANLGSVFFACGDGGLIRTDGSVAGTSVIAPLVSTFGGLATLGGYVYFAPNEFGKTQLWRTDGTPSGTTLFLELAGNGATVTSLRATSDRIYFVTTDGDRSGLFASSGGPGPPEFVGTVPNMGGVSVGSRLFFVTVEQDYSTRLWVTDGAGMVQLHSFDRLEGSPSYMTALGGRLLFQGGSANGREPWISDGTPQGTVLLADVEAGPASSSPEFAVMGSEAYFLVRESLWKTDGTVAGTVVVASNLGAWSLAAGRTRLVLTGIHTTPPVGNALWVSDGTSAGTTLVRISHDFDFVSSSVTAELSGRVYFGYRTEHYGVEVWSSDGTAGGTDVLVDLGRVTGGLGLTSMVAGTTRAFFHQRNQGMWSTDGTEAGTRPITVGQVQVDGGDQSQLFTVGDVGYSCGTKGLLRADGTDAGTMFLSPPGHSCIWAVAADGEIFFALDTPANSQSLWKSDGQPGSAVLVRDLPIYPYWPVAFGSGVLFVGHGPSWASELWTSDGTAAGTQKYFEGPFFSAEEMTALGPIVMFRSGGSLWRTDGTATGTRRLLEDGPFTYRLAGQIDGVLYFLGGSPQGAQFALWRSDGTPEGTRPLKVFGSVNWGPGEGPVVSNGRVFFVVSENGRALWSSNGTEAGTRPVPGGAPVFQLEAVPGGLAFEGGDGPSFVDGSSEIARSLGGQGLEEGSLSSFVRLGSMLLFAARDPAHGRELWRVDLEGNGTMFHTVVPCRVADTRFVGDAPPLLEGVTRDFQVGGRCGIPPDATGVVLNVTATQPTGDGHVEAGPAERSSSGARTAAFRAGQTRASFLVLGVDPSSKGRISLKLVAPGHADVILDVSGYFR